MEQLCLFDILKEKVDRAIRLFQTFEEMALRMSQKGYYLAFSGGKDSVVIYRLAQMAGIRFEAHYHLTTVDPPELVQFYPTGLSAGGDRPASLIYVAADSKKTDSADQESPVLLRGAKRMRRRRLFYRYRCSLAGKCRKGQSRLCGNSGEKRKKAAGNLPEL